MTKIDWSERDCQFPKYKGIPWPEVIERDPGYVHWLLENIETLMPDFRTYLEEALEEVGFDPDEQDENESFDWQYEYRDRDD